MRKLVFSDTEAFYTTLKAALEQDEQVEIITDYQRYSDLPERLKTLFELDKYKSETWVIVTTGEFRPHSAAVSAINYNALYYFAGAVGAAGVGAIIGLPFGPIGVAVGGGIGALVGVITAATSSGKHNVDIEIDVNGKIRLRISPINQRKSKN